MPVATSEERLKQLIESEGPMPFARFMEEALYGPEGYYSRRRLRIGEEGDFVTGSSHSQLFGRSTARLLIRLDRLLQRPAELLEAGFGDGRHLRAVAAADGEAGRRRRLRGWDRVQRPLPEGVESAESLEEVAEGEIDGVIFSYELFDAQPVHRLIGRADGTAGELWVDLDRDRNFLWRQGELSDPALAALLNGNGLEAGQIADLSPGWGPLYRQLGLRLGRGLLVTCDYGFERRRLLDPRIRRHGTLACYRRHRVHRNPFIEVGRQDLTAHVDFSTLREEGEKLGLETMGLTRQASWLVACGIFDDLEGASPTRRAEAMTLLDPAGMGEEIRVLIQARGVEPESLFDRDLLMLGGPLVSRGPASRLP
jgi:SAM-dependent MidA family methyltransferase